MTLVCLRTLAEPHPEPWSYAHYVALGGYQVWQRIVREQPEPETLVEAVKASGLRGRGGAGFPTGIKWSFMLRKDAGPRYVICNSDEGEPGTFKDRDIMRYNPHQLIEGLLIAAYVMRSDTVYNYIRGEFYEPIERFEQALLEAQEHGLWGPNSGHNIAVHTVIGAGAYICGEETALMESLEGKRGLPRFKPPFPANVGLYGRPSNINNTETYASIPVILAQGGEWFAQLGKPNNGGTKIFCVSGHVQQPGNFELPLGTPFSELLRRAGGLWPGRTLKAVIPGGSSVPVVPGEVMMQLDMDYDSLSQAGTMLGSGAVIVMDNTTCMVKVLARIAHFYYEESCGQCTPCREGTGWLARIVHRIEQGQGTMEDLTVLEEVAGNIRGRTICALGDAAAMPVQSFLKHFRHEFEHHITHQHCLASCDHAHCPH